MLETKIFKPYDKKLDTEEWPQLQLVDAVVYRHVADGPDELCDLLDTHFMGPLRITGTITKIPTKFHKMVKDLPVIGEEQASSRTAAALAKGVHGATVTVTDVLTYALESYKNPKVNSTIWALGCAAWYSITPAPEYTKYFDRSLEKAHVWDIVLEFGKSGNFKQVTVEQLFARYFQKHPGCKGIDGAENVFANYRKFLVCKMLEPTGPGSKSARTRWQNFCLWKWLTTKFTGIVKEVEGSIQAAKTARKSSTDKRAFSPGTQHGVDTLESLALEQKLKPHQLTCEWLISSIEKKSGANAEVVRSLLQGQANALSTLMTLSRQVNWVQSSLYSDLLLMSGEVPSGGNCDGSEGGEAATTANLNSTKSRSVDAFDGVNDIEQDNDPLSSPELPHHQQPKSAKGKSVLRPVMTPSIQHKSGQESGASSPLSSPPPVSSFLTPVTVEKLVAPGPSTLPKKRQTDSASNSKEPTKRSRVAEGSAVKDTNDKGEDNDKIWPPLNPGGGRPPIYCGKHISMKPESGGTWWRCKIRDCLTIIPDAHIPAGRAVIQDHLNEHYLTIQRASSALEEVPIASERSLQALLDKIERMAKVWEDIRREDLKDFDEINSALIDLERQREHDRVLALESVAEKEAERELEAHAKASERVFNNGRGRGRGRGKGKGKQ
ncbi:hypothetical protein HOY82DRAFT_593972 [Tuber indicum]|nr:hypothetical protein HOY82DRAFT_593972 [Tuber indicum]